MEGSIDEPLSNIKQMEQEVIEPPNETIKREKKEEIDESSEPSIDDLNASNAAHEVLKSIIIGCLHTYKYIIKRHSESMDIYKSTEQFVMTYLCNRTIPPDRVISAFNTKLEKHISDRVTVKFFVEELKDLQYLLNSSSLTIKKNYKIKHPTAEEVEAIIMCKMDECKRLQSDERFKTNRLYFHFNSVYMFLKSGGVSVALYHFRTALEYALDDIKGHAKYCREDCSNNHGQPCEYESCNERKAWFEVSRAIQQMIYDMDGVSASIQGHLEIVKQRKY